jgi:hypothetical protein
VLPKLLNYLAFQSFDFELPDEGYSRMFSLKTRYTHCLISYILKTEKKTEIKLDINLLSKTNKYKTKQTNRKKKYQKERKKTQHECTFFLFLYT